MTGLQKQKARLHLKRFRSRRRASRFSSPLCLALLRLPRRLMTVGFTIKKKRGKKVPLFPGKADGERFGAKQSLSTWGVFFLPRQVIRCPHLADNEATVGTIVSAMHGLLNGLLAPGPPQPDPPGLDCSSAPTVQPCRNELAFISSSAGLRSAVFADGPEKVLKAPACVRSRCRDNKRA